MNIYHCNNGWEYWYTRGYRCWWCAKYDAEGNQIGDAEHAYTREEIVKIVQAKIDEENSA